MTTKTHVTEIKAISTPIVCRFCNPSVRFMSFIEFDMELHMFIDHNIKSKSKIKDASVIQQLKG
jgi:hypothetical protein